MAAIKAQHSTDSPLVLQCKNGARLAYRKTEGAQPGVIFLGGFLSDMNGAKALALEEHCRRSGRQFIRFDYRGHGQSSGDFAEGTIGKWKEDALAVLDQLTRGPQVLVGSSMGGWIMLLTAMARPKRVAGLIGVASAPDFTEHLLWDAFTPEQQRELHEQGALELPNCREGGRPYPITMELIAESGDHLVLDGPIPVHCPVHLIHGMKDEDVPWEFSVALNEKLESQDVKTTLVDDGGHSMSEAKHLQLLCRTLDRMLKKVGRK